MHQATKTTLGGASSGVGVVALSGIGHVKGRDGGGDIQFCGQRGEGLGLDIPKNKGSTGFGEGHGGGTPDS
ncbi:unannotated protein [freshwater metagenome]|uniref:Unannotated protein n=1 Tax=freshwater metagenome TaxID=449393 RepID=A0A6J6WZE6_9ZZZZ